MSSSKSKAGAFPKRKSKAGEFPKMQLKLPEFVEGDPFCGFWPNRGLFDFPMEARDIPKVEPLTFPEWEAPTSFFELPLSLNCLKLEVLILQHADLTEIPSSFFVHLPLLRILDLSYTSVKELPCSLFTLEQLRELYLKGCECFMKLPPEIGNLQKLEKLDLDETQITHLPKEVQKLTNMQSLTLYFYEYRGKKSMQYSCSTIIPSGVISKLKKLKHLSIGVNPDDERWHENIQVVLTEILELECLQTLSIYIPQLELLKLIAAHIFEVDFRFTVGRHMQRILSSIPPAVDVKFKQSDCSLKFVKGANVPAEIKMLLRHSKALFLDRHITIKNLSEFEMKNLEQLRVCILAECKAMQTIVGGGDSNGNDDMLSHLLFLSVSHMKNLRSIWEGPTPPRSLFGMLQSLSLQSFPKLITLFSLDFLGNLSLLKELIVKDCPKLSTLISHESSKRNAHTFLPKLRKLSLLHLPELTSISSGLRIGPGLKEVGFYGCPKLRSLSRNELSSQELMVIKGETKWWKALKDRPSTFDPIFSAIHEEADVMTQLGIYNDDDIDNGPGGSSIFKAKGPKVKEQRSSCSAAQELTAEDIENSLPPCNSAVSAELMDTRRSEGRRTLRYKEEEDNEEEEEEEDMGVGEDGRRKRVMTDLYSKRGSKAGSSMPPSCQVDNCNSDLSNAKQYHRRHRVCEFHAKVPSVHIVGQQQRFCQQCSRFHELSEFDDSKRSCRRRLAGHMERRRKNATDYQ